MRSIAWLTFLLVVGCGSSGHAGAGGASSGGGAPSAGGSAPGAGGSAPGAAGKSAGGGATVSSGGVDSTYPVVPPGTLVDSVSGKADPVVGMARDITPKSVDVAATPCTDIQFDPSNPSRLYAVYGGGGGIWRSEDSGQTWVQFGNMPMPNALGRIRVDPKDPKHLYATGGVVGQNWGFWASNDGGETWVMPGAFSAGAANGSWTNDMYNIAVDPTDFNHFIMSSHRGWQCCGEDAGVIESTDGGKTFAAHAPSPGMNHGQGIAFLFDPESKRGDSSTWLVGGGYAAGVNRTNDAGATWTRVNEQAQDSHGGFFANYSSQGYLYIGVSGGLLRSTDNGATWALETSGLGGWFYGAVSDGSKLYTGTAYVGVAYNAPLLVSPEGGEGEGTSWSPYSEQKFVQGPFRMVFEPKNRVIYGANWNSGAWALNVGD